MIYYALFTCIWSSVALVSSIRNYRSLNRMSFGSRVRGERMKRRAALAALSSFLAILGIAVMVFLS